MEIGIVFWLCSYELFK